MRIATILSMKKGINLFLFRELQVFTDAGAQISLYPTKYKPGLYNAQEPWTLHRWHVFQAIMMQPIHLLRNPVLYLGGLFQALRVNVLVDFLLAWYFSPAMAHDDLIYATFGDHKLFIGYFCKQILHKPLAVTIHAYELYENPNPRMFEMALAACDQIITVTEYNKEILASRYDVPPGRIEVVRINVDVEEYHPEKKFIILIVAFFAERKGHDVLFKAIKELNQPDLEVWVVGDEGTERVVDVRGLAGNIGVESQVAFFGPLSGNALKAVYHACDVFCLPCRVDSQGVSEGFPTVLAEAMAFGKPVITTRHVEIPRVVQEILVDENDVEGLAAAIRRVYQSAALRERLGVENRATAERLFSLRNAGRTIEIFTELIHGSNPVVSGRRQPVETSAPANPDEIRIQ